MRGVRIAAVALLAPAVLAAPAQARPRVACNQVPDAVGDGNPGYGPSRDALDIVSADVATGKNNLVAAVRLRSLAADPALAAGVVYSFAWVVNGTPQRLTLIRYDDGTSVSEFDPDTGQTAPGDAIAARVTVDAATGTITWTLPRVLDHALAVRRGNLLTELAAEARPALNLVAGNNRTSLALPGDVATTDARYVDGTRTCLHGT